MKKSKSSSQGIQSSQKREVNVRTGTTREGILPAYPGTLGSMRGDHATSRGRTGPNNIPMNDGKTGISVELGNTCAAATVAGPGGSRTVMKSGAQAQYGAGNPGSPTQPGAADRGSRA